MRKALLFAVFIGLLFVDASMATVTQAWTTGDSAASSYPDWASGKPTTAAQLQVKDANITTATTNYVVRKVDGIAGDVASLANTATTDNATVTANGTAVTALENGRIAHPTRNVSICPANAVCGYISANGTSGTKQWVQIITQ